MNRAPQLDHSRGFLSLLAFLALCLAVAGIGGAVTATSVNSWYVGVNKPSFNPPNWVFAPVWTTLFLMMAISGWRLWRRRAMAGARKALAAWWLQLALNLAWAFLFFGARAIGAALVEVVALLAAIIATMVLAWRVDRLAGALFVPYVAWVSFATVLNAALWRLN